MTTHQTPERASLISNDLQLNVALPVGEHATALEVLGISIVKPILEVTMQYNTSQTPSFNSMNMTCYN
jgi:hypothetical protein